MIKNIIKMQEITTRMSNQATEHDEEEIDKVEKRLKLTDSYIKLNNLTIPKLKEILHEKYIKIIEQTKKEKQQYMDKKKILDEKIKKIKLYIAEKERHISQIKKQLKMEVLDFLPHGAKFCNEYSSTIEYFIKSKFRGSLKVFEIIQIEEVKEKYFKDVPFYNWIKIQEGVFYKGQIYNRKLHGYGEILVFGNGNPHYFRYVGIFEKNKIFDRKFDSKTGLIFLEYKSEDKVGKIKVFSKVRPLRVSIDLFKLGKHDSPDDQLDFYQWLAKKLEDENSGFEEIFSLDFV